MSLFLILAIGCILIGIVTFFSSKNFNARLAAAMGTGFGLLLSLLLVVAISAILPHTEEVDIATQTQFGDTLLITDVNGKEYAVPTYRTNVGEKSVLYVKTSRDSWYTFKTVRETEISATISIKE